MTEIFLVRHAQASFSAADYDQLSPLGFEQARWLGEYFCDRGIRFDHVFTGTMARQRQTADAILAGSSQPRRQETLPGLNEFDFHQLGAAYCRLTATPLPERGSDHRPFFRMLRDAMVAWTEHTLFAGDLPRECLPDETWVEFHQRVAAAMEKIRDSGSRRTLVVSSGGAIAMALSQVLKSGAETFIDLNMQIKNTGVTELRVRHDALLLSSFNNAPHLERSDRQHALTYA